MSTTEAHDYEAIFTVVRSWPAWQRFQLVQDVLRTLAPPHPWTPERREALERLRGLLATDGPPPTDEEVKQWLEEERMKKYG